MNEYLLDQKNNSKGAYLSGSQIDLLLLISIDNIDDLRKYVEDTAQFGKNTFAELIKDVEDKNSLDSLKREIFKKYQDTYISHENYIHSTEMQHALYKLQSFGFTQEEYASYLNVFLRDGLEKGYDYIKSKHGEKFLRRFQNHSTEDFEECKNLSYDEVASLYERLSKDNTFNELVTSGNLSRSSMKYIDGNYKFDDYALQRELKLCDKLGMKLRMHALFDYGDISKLEGKSKEEVLDYLDKYINSVFDAINKTNSNGNKIDMLEIFNELVEYNKGSNCTEYNMIWEEKFGITLEDMINLINKHPKPDGVSYMYNETMLEENQSRRDKVMEVIGKIDDLSPGLIDTFGTQMHLNSTHASDNSEYGKSSELRGELNMLKSLKSTYPGMNQEITEFDIHIDTKTMISALLSLNNGNTKETLDTSRMEIIQEISRMINESGLDFNRTSYWTLLDNYDHNLRRSNDSLYNYGIKLDSVMSGAFGTLGKGIDYQEQFDRQSLIKIQNYLMSQDLVNELNNKIDSNSDVPREVQIINGLYQYIVQNIDYGTEAVLYDINNPDTRRDNPYKDAYTTTGFWNVNQLTGKRSAVCGSISEVARGVLNQMGIKADYINGHIGNMGHRWLMVNIDGKQYMVDFTAALIVAKMELPDYKELGEAIFNGGDYKPQDFILTEGLVLPNQTYGGFSLDNNGNRKDDMSLATTSLDEYLKQEIIPNILNKTEMGSHRDFILVIPDESIRPTVNEDYNVEEDKSIDESLNQEEQFKNDVEVSSMNENIGVPTKNPKKLGLHNKKYNTNHGSISLIELIVMIVTFVTTVITLIYIAR